MRRLAVLVIASLPLIAQTAHRPKNTLPSVSPDGTRIAFTSDHDADGTLLIIRPDGTGEEPLAHGIGVRPQWASDSRHILFAGDGADEGKLFIVDRDGKNRRVVTTVAGRSTALSPDGGRVLYLAGPWTSTAMFVAKIDGSGAQKVAGGSTTAWNGAWSPDGTRIAYTYGDSSKVLQIHVVNADGTDDRPVTKMPAEEGSAQMPAWSPDGRRLAIQVNNGPAHTAHIWIIDLTSGEARKLGAHKEPYFDEAPAWFPDGKRVAFQSNRNGSMEIWAMRDDGSDLRQVTGGRK